MTKKIILITGSSRGIGAATAIKAAAQDYAVCINYHQNKIAAQVLVDQIQNKGGQAIAVAADVSQEADVERLFNQIDKELGPITALVNERHCFAGSQDNLFLVVDIAAEDDFLSKRAVPHHLNLTTSTKKFIHFAHYYLLHNERDFYTDSLVNQLLLNFSSKTFLSDPDQKIMKAKNWINLHVAAPIDVDRVARHCHISSSQLQRRFKQNTGYGIAEYWRMKKMQQAKCLLSLGRSSIEEIAFEIGYENLSAFSRRFSQVFGESPSQWRKKLLTAKKMRDIGN